MRSAARLRPLLFCVLTATAAVAGDRSIGSLAWRPTSRLSESLGTLDLTHLSGVKIGIKAFTDTRADKDVLGENLEKSRPRFMTMREDAAAFLTQHISELMLSGGLPMAAKPEEATVTISAEVLSFKVIERDTYQAETRLMIQVQSGDQVLWRGIAAGTATRFGRSFKIENYNEVLSDSLIDMVASLLKSGHFLNALAGKAPVAPALQAAP